MDCANSYKKISRIKLLINYFLVYLVFAFGGIPFFSAQKWTKVVFWLIAAIIFFLYNKKIGVSIVKVLIFVLIIFLAQLIKFHGGSLINFGLLFILVTIPYMVLKIVGLDFTKYYVNITYVFAVIGLIFWSLSMLLPEFYAFTETIAPKLGTDPTDVVDESFIIYTYERNLTGLLRSPGPFWEPGAYAAFLIPAIIFNLRLKQSIINKKTIVFILALLTTFSTSGYIALLFISVNLVLATKINHLLKIFMVIIAMIIGYYITVKLDFMGEKIQKQYENQITESLETPTSGRILGARKALYSLSNNPITGKGLVLATASEKDERDAGGYGFFNLAARIGIIGFLIYIVLLFKSLLVFKHNLLSAFLSMCALLSVLFAQAVYDRPLYLMIIMLTMVYPQKLFINKAF